jgi:hypothetical protein
MSKQSKQGVLSYRIEREAASPTFTALAGLAPYLDLICGSGLMASMRRNLGVRDGDQGWTDEQITTSLILLNLAGGESVEDLEQLNTDKGLAKLLSLTEKHGLCRRARREFERRWRKTRTRSVASPSAARRYLGAFHDEEQEELRVAGKAFIPEANVNLLGLRRVNADLLAFAQRSDKQKEATLDIDATLIETLKAMALYCYKGFRAYQPFNIYWAERGMMLHTEFRDGNVPAGYQQTRVLKEALSYLPEGVVKVRVRSDTAGYEHELLRYLASEEKERFGVIEFAISCDVTQEFRKAVGAAAESDWRPVYRDVRGRLEKTGREWAEVCFVPNQIAFSSKDPVYRYIATREALKDQPLPGMEDKQPELPFQTMRRKGVTYKIFGVVTNMDWDGERLIRWHDARCGKCEEAHKILKEDFAGGRMPSGEFGVNAAWWQIAVLSMNLSAVMNRIVLGGQWLGRRMKAIRFLIINVPGRVMEKARQLCLKLGKDHKALDLLIGMRRRIGSLSASPP